METDPAAQKVDPRPSNATVQMETDPAAQKVDPRPSNPTV
jgi:hypothetical protein